MNDIALKFADIILPMAQSVGDVAQYGWDVVVRQQYAYGVVLILIAGLSCIEAYVGYRAIKWAYAQPRIQKTIVKDGGYSFEKTDTVETMSERAVWVSIFGYISQVNWIVAKLSLVSGVLYLYNPEFFAIQFLISVVQ